MVTLTFALACGKDGGTSGTDETLTGAPPTSTDGMTTHGGSDSTTEDPGFTATATESSEGSGSFTATAADSDGTGAPMILIFTATPDEITEDGSVTFLAQVVDPDGLDDIVGGLLLSEGGDATYGAFVQVSEGSFQIELDWNAIDAIEPINDSTRTFSAEFNDLAGNVATDSVELGFDCQGLVACDGVCTELGTDDDCATCGDACIGDEHCNNGDCTLQPTGCGDGMISPGEQCDGLDLQGFDCESLGLGGGVLSCDPVMCTFDTSRCTP